MFHDLDNSPVSFGMRIKRLEQKFGGHDRQVQCLMEVLAQAKTQYGGKRVPYTDLLDLTRQVDSHLAKGPKGVGAPDHILVPLRELVPDHLKTGYSMEMKRCGAEETGKGFLKYLLDALMVEIKAQETNPKRTEAATEKTTTQGKVNGEKPRILGKLYCTGGKVLDHGTCSSSGSEAGSPYMGRRKVRMGSENESQNFVTMSKARSFEPPKCTCCNKGSHFLHSCYKFVHKLDLGNKQKFAEKDGRCFRCLRGGHLRVNCGGREIECRFCKEIDHHYLLCEKDQAGTDDDQGVVKVADLIQLEKEPEDTGFEALGEAVTKKRVTPLQMVLHVLDQDKQMIKLNAMADTGSTHNIMEMEALQRMGLEGTPCKYTVTGHGGHTTTHEAVCAEVVMCSPDGRNQFKTKFFAYKNPCGKMLPEDWSGLKRGWTHLRKLDIPPPVAERPMEVILGCVDLRMFEAIRPAAVKGAGDPVAKFTPLGWMVGGRTRPEVEPVDEGHSHAHTGTILMTRNNGVSVDEVSQDGKSLGDVTSDVADPTSIAGTVNFHQDCNEECRQKYNDLKENMRRVWDLETEEE